MMNPASDPYQVQYQYGYHDEDSNQGSSTMHDMPAMQMMHSNRPDVKNDPARYQPAASTGSIAQLAPMGLSTYLKDNLRLLKNLLKLPKARRWVMCEFFYADIDRELYLGENDFETCLKDSFPNLRTRMMNRVQWRKIRALIGKARRCSPAFFDEEIASLNTRRQRIRELYAGRIYQPDTDFLQDLPPRIPRQLAVGDKVFVRLRDPSDGIFVASIDALMDENIRVIFDKEDRLQPATVSDTAVMRETIDDELIPIAYFIEKSRANFPAAQYRQLSTGVTLALGARQTRSTLIKYDPVLTAIVQRQQYDKNRAMSSFEIKQEPSSAPMTVTPNYPMTPNEACRNCANAALHNRDEKVGQYPVRLLVMIMKIQKLCEAKSELVQQAHVINDTCHKMSRYTFTYPMHLQLKFSDLLLDLEQVNKLLEYYTKGVRTYQNVLMPHFTNVPMSARPESLRRLCNTHATQIVKFCNQELNVHSQKALSTVTSLTALLLQIRALGMSSYLPHDLQGLTTSLNEIRNHLNPRNVAAFQDFVESHMKEIHKTMLSSLSRKAGTSSKY